METQEICILVILKGLHQQKLKKSYIEMFQRNDKKATLSLIYHITGFYEKYSQELSINRQLRLIAF